MLAFSFGCKLDELASARSSDNLLSSYRPGDLRIVRFCKPRVERELTTGERSVFVKRIPSTPGSDPTSRSDVDDIKT